MDGSYKLPVNDDFGFYAQQKETGYIVGISQHDSHINELRKTFDYIEVGVLTVEGAALIGNKLNTTIKQIGGNTQWSSPMTISVGKNNAITNALVPDGVYNLDNVLIEGNETYASFLVINRKWHPLFMVDNGENVVAKPVVTALPVSNISSGEECKLRDNSLVGLWCNSTYADPDIAISTLTTLIVQSLGSQSVGEPIEVTIDGSNYGYPCSQNNLYFDIA